ncbi:MAG: GspE/PulE family protein [Planctomycetia bacterium]|nr:GspE/PulE family protein [Planctomycetia bacterium]
MQCVAWGERFRQRLEGRNPADPQHVIGLVDAILASAREAGASDVHLVPQEAGLAMSFRLDGVLQPVAELPRVTSSNVIARLKVLAELLTYRTDVPQEGRVRSDDRSVEMRVSTFPTLFGEKAVVRLFAGSGEFRFLGELGLPVDIEPALQRLLERRNGLLLITGPAGSGKTTTAYACLREIVRSSGATRSIASLEDPIESVVPGVAQSQINAVAGFDYATGLKSLMRQDPEVIFVGEIRDQNTAMTAFQASLTGQLVLTTFHSSSAAGAISRLSDMGIEPYLLRSGVVGIVGQRLLRRLCACATQNIGANNTAPTELSLGIKVARVFQPVGCNKCGGTGYRGRMIISELLQPDLGGLGRAILSRGDATEIEALAVQAGMTSLWQRALQAIEAGQTSPAEVRRVLGWMSPYTCDSPVCSVARTLIDQEK